MTFEILGKTALISRIIQDIPALLKNSGHPTTAVPDIIFRNAMSILSSKSLVKSFACEFLKNPQDYREQGELMEALKLYFTSGSSVRKSTPSSPLRILIIDEMDALLKDSHTEPEVREIFHWANSPTSRVMLIGITNCLELSTKFVNHLLDIDCTLYRSHGEFLVPNTLHR